jgi:hypothetical protein
VRMKLHRKITATTVVAIACILFPLAMHSPSGTPADDAPVSAAICPIVCPVDQSASDRGYHYLFYGNGFFINEQGYLITAAHVLSQLHGGQPYILPRPLSGPRRFVPANLVAVDRDHDVAILRAAPNPFDGAYKVGFLQLSYDWPARGRAVLAASERPSKPLDAYTLDASVDDRSSGEVFDFPFSRLDTGCSDTEIVSLQSSSPARPKRLSPSFGRALSRLLQPWTRAHRGWEQPSPSSPLRFRWSPRLIFRKRFSEARLCSTPLSIPEDGS